MFMFIRILISIGLTLSAASVFAGTVRRDVPDSQYTNDLEPFLNGVGKLSVTTSTGNYWCSGTIISPEAVLTAAHSANDATTVQFDLAGVVPAAGWTAHPKFRAADQVPEPSGATLGLVAVLAMLCYGRSLR